MACVPLVLLSTRFPPRLIALPLRVKSPAVALKVRPLNGVLAAKSLLQQGLARARPLAGGLDGWQAGGRALGSHAVPVTAERPLESAG